MEALRLAYASLRTPPVTLRPAWPRDTLEALARDLESEGVNTSPCRYARALKVSSGHLNRTRAYRGGRVALQDEASQLVSELVAPRNGERIMDLCAAPGMKTAQVAQTLGRGTLVACDRSARRLRLLRTLLPASMPDGVCLLVVRLDAARGLPFRAEFDRILLDAPCSGTGTLARHPEIKWRLAPADIGRLAELQARMLRNALPALAPGGRLVYATCSLESEENEGVVERVLAEQSSFRRLMRAELCHEHPRLAPLFDTQGYFRTWPDRDGMDGFRAAVIVRVMSAATAPVGSVSVAGLFST